MTKGIQVLLKLVDAETAFDVRLIQSESGGAWFEVDDQMEESVLPSGDALPLFLGKERAVFFPSHRIEWMLAAERNLEK
jgi:hypothetical protein